MTLFPFSFSHIKVIKTLISKRESLFFNTSKNLHFNNARNTFKNCKIVKELVIARLRASSIPGRQKQFGFFTVYFRDTMVFREAYETGKRGTLSDFFLLVTCRKRSFCSYLCKIKKTQTHTFGQFSAGGFLMKKSSRFRDQMMFKAAIPTQIITSKVNLCQSGSVF